MDEKGSMGGNAGGRDENADARMGMIQVNDLVYRLETDLSVAINRTHKTNFFQNNSYTNGQTSIIVLNSGADYIDPRRSFLSLSVQIPVTPVNGLTPPLNTDLANGFISCYFGKNGSVLNLIDSVVVSSRSGDELSRVQDFGQLQNMLIPEMFGQEWRDTIGQTIGLGSYLGGYNDIPVVTGPPATAPAVSEQQRQKFIIPLYLLSPVFNYGRLLPSMLMSGLRIEIKWKPLEIATQQMWEGVPQEWPADGSVSADPNFMTATMTEFKSMLGAGSLSGTGGATNSFGWTTADTVTWVPTAASATTGILTYNNTATAFWTGNDTHLSVPAATPPIDIPTFNVGDVFVFRIPITTGAGGFQEFRFPILGILSPTQIVSNATYAAFTALAMNWVTNGGQAGPWRSTLQLRSLPYQRGFGQPYLHYKGNTPSTPLVGYTILDPQMQLCSIQLTDSIQRTLNEYSAVNGLEIVFADYDRTSAPYAAGQQAVYLEVRKSASRALMALARLVNSTSPTQIYDGFASGAATFWNYYQWQLGSLYFPNQRVQDTNSVTTLAQDNELTLAYAYTQDAFDRFHPKAAPTMSSMRGAGLDWNVLYTHPTQTDAEHNPSSYLAPYSTFGKWGSFVNGATTIATTLERSTIFDLSGIPINNSRVLALRGQITVPTTMPNTTLFIFLKFVKLARCFLVNIEVEQ